MKKALGYMMVIAALLLSGCNMSGDDESEVADDLEANIQTIAKAQKIEKEDNGKVLKTYTEKDEIETFITQQNLEKWESVTALPNGAKKQYEYVFMQSKTIKLGEKKDNPSPLQEVARLITYKDIPYVSLQVSFIDLYFQVPDEVAAYLNLN